MMPDKWKQPMSKIQIRKSHQYIQMKVKLFFIYEEKDKAIQQTFIELMNF